MGINSSAVAGVLGSDGAGPVGTVAGARAGVGALGSLAGLGLGL